MVDCELAGRESTEAVSFGAADPIFKAGAGAVVGLEPCSPAGNERRCTASRRVPRTATLGRRPPQVRNSVSADRRRGGRSRRTMSRIPFGQPGWVSQPASADGHALQRQPNKVNDLACLNS